MWFPNRRCSVTKKTYYLCSLNPPLPSDVAPLIFRQARSLLSSHLTSRSSLTWKTYPRSCVDASDHPQLRAPSPDEFSPSLPFDPPPALNLLQPPGDALIEASGLFIDDVLLNLHTRTHRTTDQSDGKDSEGALEEDAVEAADYVDHETDGFWNGEDLAVEDDVDPREGIVSDWDLLTKEFIVEAEELGKFAHPLLHTS